MAGSGWCHHPLRKTTSELLIMVRRNELACRDQWAHSLWEEGVWAPARDAVGQGLDAIEAGRPVPPASEGDIAALLRADAKERPVAPLVSAQEDVVLGEARFASDRAATWQRDVPPAAPRRDNDPKTAIKRAREAYQERLRAQAAERAALAAEAPLATALADAAEAPIARDDEHEPALAAGRPVAHAEDDADSPAPVHAEPSEGFGVDDAAASAFAAWEDSPGEAGAPAEALVGEASVNGHVADEIDDWWTAGAAAPDAPFAEWDDSEDDPVAPADPVDEAPNNYAPATERAWSPAWFVDDPAPAAAGPIASSPWSVASASAGADVTAAGSVAYEDDWQDDLGVEIGSDAPARDAAWIEADPDMQAGASAWPGEGRHEEAGFVPEEPAEEPAQVVAVEAPPERLAIPLLPVGSVAPGVPRICRTCRDFRPAEGGDRGWCANEWAFTNRQMVQPDDPAPCETSAGSWWLPTDDLCLADADVSTHGQPTPYLDKWLPHHREREAERKRS